MKKSDLFSTMIASRAGLVYAVAAALCLAVQALPTPVEKPYNGIQVLSVEPSTEEQVEVLSELSKEAGIDFWSFRPAALEKNVLAVSPDLLDDVSALLQQAGMEAQVLIPDLQVIIDREAREQEESRDLERRTSFGFKAASSKGATFKRYMRYQEIADYAQELQKKYPNRVKVESMGKTVEGRDLWVIKVANQLEGSKNPVIFVDAGIHAREWIAPATALYLLNQITENPDVAAGLLNGLDWYIVPVVNPDGYEYTHTNERMWRKNRSKKAGCAGVDLNRNFGFHWNENGASQNPCSEVYSGPKGFSEPESQILRDFILKHKDQIKSYVTLHSYGKYILYPWGYTSDLPADWKKLDNIGQEANKALIASGSGRYTVGSSTNVLYAAAGGSDDWAKGGAGIPQSFTIELPGGGSMGFDMPPANIEKTVQQVFQGLKVFAQAAKSA